MVFAAYSSPQLQRNLESISDTVVPMHKAERKDIIEYYLTRVGRRSRSTMTMSCCCTRHGPCTREKPAASGSMGHCHDDRDKIQESLHLDKLVD